MSGTPGTGGHLVRNERLKLSATLLNTLASGAMVVGVVTPLAAALYRISPLNLSAGQAAGYGAAFLAIGVVLHYLGRRVLGGLRE